MSDRTDAAQVLVTFEDVAVRFSAEEWATLAGWQQALHKEVMEEMAQLLLSLGQSVPALALLSLTDPQEAAGRPLASDAAGRDLSGDGGEERAFPGDYPDADVPGDPGQVEEDGSPLGTQEGEPRGSLHLSALMKLVKEIPEFLFGTPKAAADPAEAAGGSDAATSTEQAGVKTEEPSETPHPPGLDSGAVDVALSWPGRPDTPAGSVSTSGTERGSPPGSLHAAVPMANSPLRGLLNCLKEIPTRLRDTRGDKGQKRLEMETRAWQATGSNDSCRTGADTWPESVVKTEAMAESSPLRSLENCLRDLAAAERPSHPGTPESSPCDGSSRQEQEQEQEQEQGSLELRARRCPGEAPAAAGTPDTTSDLPGDRQGGPSSSGSAEGEREPRGLPEPRAPPRCQEAAPAEESPLQGLLNCLKEILVRGPRRPPSPAPGESRPSLRVETETGSGAPHGPGSHRALAAGERCPETRGRSCRGEGAMKTEGSTAPSLPRGPSSGWEEARRLVKTEAGTEDAAWQSRLRCAEHAAARRPCAPAGPVSTHSPDGDKAPWRVPLGPWHSYPEEPAPGTSPLRGLVNCLKGIPVPSACLSSLAGAEAAPPRAWPGEDVGAESSPLRGLENCLKDIPVAQPRQAHPPVCPPRRSPAQRPPGTAWRSLGEDLGAETSPLRGLENCLKEIPVAVRSRCGTPASRCSVGGTPEGHGGPELATRPLKTEVKIEALPEHSRLPGLGSSEKEVPHYPSKLASRSVEGDLGPRPADAGAWRSYVDGAATEDTPPLRGLENCLKDIPAPQPRCPNAAAGPLRASLAQVDVEPWRAAPWPWGASAGGRMSCRTEVPVCRPRASSTPSAGSAETEPGPRSPGTGTWSRCHEDAAPLHGLENCPRDLASEGCSGSSNGDVPEPETWAPRAEGAGPADAPRYSSAACAERPPGNEASCSSASGAQVRCLRRPGKGSKRPHPAAQGGAARPPRSSSRRPDASEQQTEAEWGTSPKRQCPTNAPSESCSCESHTPRVFQAEAGHFRAVLSEKLDRISEDVATLCRDVSSMRRRMARLEQEARGWAREATALRKGSQGLSKTLRRLEHRCRALETRARRNNLRLLGLPEGAEGGDAIAFLQTALPGMLGLPADAPALEIESARRVPGGTRWDPAATTRPRALVFRLLRLADKAAVLRAVRKHVEPLVWGGARVAVFPDICPKLSRRRRARHTAAGRTWRAAALRVGPWPSGCPRGQREPLPGPTAGTWDREEREGRDPSGQ